MLEFDGSTLANMTAALDRGCKLLPASHDTDCNRKRIAEALINAARSDKRALFQLIEIAELEAAATIDKPTSRLKLWFNQHVLGQKDFSTTKPS